HLVCLITKITALDTFQHFSKTSGATLREIRAKYCSYPEKRCKPPIQNEAAYTTSKVLMQNINLLTY
ncbi:MAG: hypothetical protein U0K14_07715, partial [Eggerthellaceae bacterium]|nr:hypothetical protein [Eggerthellaceae bacterium]